MPMDKSEHFSYEDVPSVQELFTKENFVLLGSDRSLTDRISVLRDREAGIRLVTDKIGLPEVNRICREHIVKLLAEQVEVDESVIPDNPDDFLQMIFSLPLVPSTAWWRRRIREISRIYRLKCTDTLFVPHDVKGFQKLWELAMEGEPRWSKDFPTSEFRVKRAWIRASVFKENRLQACCEPKDYERELTRLLAFLSDDTLLSEIRAICGFVFFEWIHPFGDGNGHTGRMLMISKVGKLYNPLTIMCLAIELVIRKGRTSKQMEILRTRTGNLNDFCSGILTQLEDAQKSAEDILRKACQN